MDAQKPLRIALLGRGSPTASPRRHPMLEPIFAALEDLGVGAVPIAYAEAAADQARAQLMACDGALVWVNPVTDGVDRTRLDTLLREVATHGVWVSAHPDVILKMGVKEVLTRAGLGVGRALLRLGRGVSRPVSGAAVGRSGTGPQAESGERQRGRVQGGTA